MLAPRGKRHNLQPGAEPLALRRLCRYPRLSTLKVLRSIPATVRACQAAAKPVILVPTMGALHRGHTQLIDRAKTLAGKRGTVVVSIFVNPMQFGPKEDLNRYPRPFASDRRLCEQHGANLLFCPTPGEMYPPGFSTWVTEESVSLPLCGASRPGHFRGVCTVVLKLFAATQPQIAVFGLKDFQQCTVIRRMVRDLNLPVRIESVETVREDDGLALSSRNAYLTPEERSQAPVLRQALLGAEEAYRGGETRAAAIKRQMLGRIATAPLANVDYIEISDADTLAPLRVVRPNSVIALAAFFGRTRLIDNLWLR